MFEDVVVGIRDRDAGRDAVALARELVAPRGKLTLAHVEVVTGKPAPDSASARDASHRRDALEQLTALREELRVDAELACPEAGSVPQGLHELASSRGADLLVVSASRRDEIAREMIGDHTREILEGAPCAVAVAPLSYYERAAQITKVGVAYDGSAESERALALARALAAEREAELSAFEAVRAPTYARDPWNVEGEIDERVEQARKRLGALDGVEPHAEFADNAVKGLHDYGGSVDLLVLGAHDYTPVDHLLERSTSQRLADDTSTPLLVLATADRAAVHASE
ncbi:MAG TPA: universal stress protein [Solirubrobacteraceae bacterium]